MFKLCVLFAIVAAVYGAPAPAPGYLAAPALAALPSPLVTASSSQYIARNYNNLAALPIAYAASPVAYATHAIAPAYTAYAAPALVATSSTVRCLNDAEYRNSMRMARGSGCKEDPRESSYIREPRLVFSGITLLPPISSYARINKMFKLFLFAALLAFAAAAPAPAPGAILSAPLVTSYAGAPIVSSLGTPVAYSAYSAPLAYNTYASPYSYVPYAYKAGYYI
ncbi:cuticle protein 21-like [Vespula pensylvanica]|uniref:cuticle protein 21-like n=1 Tax=Vespula pensylvanica TaxID=30213 RepID=UPI001CBA4992|nr:cuticle protein 21-like [Vespula pensylvanica]